MEGITLGFSLALSPINLSYAFLGAFLGTAIGVLPGLGPAATIALLLPITFQITSPLAAVIMLAGIYYGAMYGGSTTSILLKIPGEAASVVTCIDGYEMARKGRAGAALGISAIGSFIAGTIGILGMQILAPPLSSFALKFGPPEYSALTLLGLLLAVYLSGTSALKGVITALVGLALSLMGLDSVAGTARYNLGSIDIVTVIMGLFGVGEILYNLESVGQVQILTTKVKNIYPTLKDLATSKWAVLRGSVIGFFIGLLPGGGAIIASLISYTVEKRISTHPEDFGKGAIEGVAAPESANNAAATSSFIPLLSLGIPGNASIAMIYAALLIHGVQPSPSLITENPGVFWGVVASMYIGNAMLLILNLPLVGLWVQLLKVKYAILAPLICIICLLGVYSFQCQIFDVWVMLFFGVIGYFMRKLDFESGPLLLGFVLGPIFELSARQSLRLSGGDPAIFVSRPISAVLLIACLFIIVGYFWKRKDKPSPPQAAEG
jgi:putative tricarboxylic transport membrane protein